MGKKNKPKRSKSKDDDFNLKDVLDLGGTEEDFEMLKNVEEISVTASAEKTKNSLGEDEFKNFFKSLGFEKVQHEFITEDLEEDEDVEPSDEEDTEEDTNEEAINVNAEHEKNKKTKEKEEKKKQNQKIEKIVEESPLQDASVSSTTHFTKNQEQSSDVKTKKTDRLPTKTYQKISELVKVMPRKSVCKITIPWYDNPISNLPTDGMQFDVTHSTVVELKALGENLLRNEAEIYKNKKHRQDSSDNVWLKTVVTSGTLSDRVAGYTLMLQNAPVQNYWCLETFINMLKKKGKREAVIGLEALRDVFLAELLPDSRKLRFFHNQPLSVLEKIYSQETGGATSKRVELQRHLLQWAYEDKIKTSYQLLVQCLRDFFLQDPLEAIKTKGMKAALELLTSKPEQEKELLTMLVNKLGDPKYKIASKALHMLNCLIQEHPLMQGVVIRAVRDLLLRPNVLPKCQYYCICFLSAQILSHERKDVADLLIQIYLGFFKAAVKKKQVDDKLLSAILTGVNRAYPYANTDDMKIIEELDILFRTVHVSGFGTSVQALTLLFQILSSRNDLSDRFYNALYGALLHPELPICTNRHPMFLNLIFRSLKADPSEPRVQAFLKRLLQTCSLQLAPYTSAVLILVTETLKVRPGLSYFIDGSKFSSKTDNENTSQKETGKLADESDEEHFVDADDEEKGQPKQPDKSSSEKGTSWTHLHKKSLHRNATTYNPTHRNPMFSNAEHSSLWELHRMTCHFHPSVARFASEVVSVAKSGQSEDQPTRYPGDPLQDFTLMRFLDKFVYRNPKSRHEKDINANMGDAPFRRKRKLTLAQAHEVAANTPEFLAKKNYNPEEVFLQRYFASRASTMPQVEKKEKSAEEQVSDIESVSDDEFEHYLSSAEGQAELDRSYNFADGAGDPGNKKRKMELVEDSDVDNSESENECDIDGDESDVNEISDEENPFDEGGMFFDGDDDDQMDEVDDEMKKIKKKKGKKMKKKTVVDVDAFDMMLEENTQNKFTSGGSSAVRNRDRSSVKQLQWERKREVKDIIAKKRARKRSDKFEKKKKHFGGKKSFGAKRRIKQKGARKSR